MKNSFYSIVLYRGICRENTPAALTEKGLQTENPNNFFGFMWGLFNFSTQFDEHFGKKQCWKIHIRWAKTPHILVLSYLKEVILQVKSHTDIHCIAKVKNKQEKK